LYAAPNGNPDQAIEECGKTISQSADFAPAYYARGGAFREKKDLDRAIADFSKFIELKPADAGAYVRRGDAYFEKKNFESATADYNKAIELDAANEPAKTGLQKIQTEQAKAAKAAPAASADKSNPPPIISVGSLNERKVRLAMPLYPPNAKRLGVRGDVEVQITLNETGDVIAAKAVSGNALLYAAAEDAARKSKFQPVVINSQPVKASGFIIYRFSQ
jgi:TonB family protein